MNFDKLYIIKIDNISVLIYIYILILIVLYTYFLHALIFVVKLFDINVIILKFCQSEEKSTM